MPEELQTFMTEMGTVFTAFGALYALANCFFGYKLQRVWIALTGFLIGLAAGFAGGVALKLHAGAALLIGVALGLVLALLANKAYRVGIFIFCGLAVFGVAVGLVPAAYQWLGILLGVAGGIAAGVLAVKFLRPAVILSTAVGYGVSGAQMVLSLFGVESTAVVLLAGAALALCGCIVQFRTTADHAGA